jgi:hypothetical protein
MRLRLAKPCRASAGQKPSLRRCMRMVAINRAMEQIVVTTRTFTCTARISGGADRGSFQQLTAKISTQSTRFFDSHESGPRESEPESGHADWTSPVNREIERRLVAQRGLKVERLGPERSGG